MKFTRKEFITTTVFDKELTVKSEIDTVVKNLHKESIDFSLVLRRNMHSSTHNLIFENVKITKVHSDNTVDLLVIRYGQKTTMKNIDISDLLEVKAITKKYKIIDVDSDVTRFDLLDFS